MSPRKINVPYSDFARFKEEFKPVSTGVLYVPTLKNIVSSYHNDNNFDAFTVEFICFY